MCDASCFCNGWMNVNCVDSCIMEEIVMLNPTLFNMLNTCGPFNYNQGTLLNCQTNLSSGYLDCCGAEQWYCDSSAGCSYVNLAQISANITSTSGLGCVRVYPSDSQYQTGTLDNYHFTSQLDCQEDCRWVCDPNGTATCTFAFQAPLFSSYPSAFSCYIATINCDCASAPTEWWCYDDQDPLSTMGGCISNTTWLNYTQSLGVYGVGGAQMVGGATAFASEVECWTQCRFCCDESGANGGLCEYHWDAVGCCGVCNDYQSELACSLGNNPYPCFDTMDLYYCDTIVGCTQFPSSIAPGSGPTGTMDGWVLIIDCYDKCAFDCGEDCECEITLTPDYTGANPMNGFGAPWSALVNCVIATANGDKCCGCEGCADNAVIWITHYNQNTANWQTTGVQADTLTNPVPQWVQGTWTPTGQQGEVVMHNGCCFIVTNTHHSGISTISPTQDYSNYVNNMASTNSVDWPSLMSNWGNPIIYFPCDPSCVSVTGSTGSSQSWYCDANITTNIPNCVQDTGVWTAPYSDNVFGLGQTSYTNNNNNGFASHHDCTMKCRFCCVEIIGGCKQCCRHHYTSLYYTVTLPPCKCNIGDIAVSWASCKGDPDGPIDNDKYIQQMSDSYLETYDNARLNQGTTNSPGPTNPCVQNVSCAPGFVWEGFLGGQGCCCCVPISTSSIWGCELVWGDTDCLTTMYSCVTLTHPCGEPDPCDCIGVTINWSMSPHEGIYTPTWNSTWSHYTNILFRTLVRKHAH